MKEDDYIAGGRACYYKDGKYYVQSGGLGGGFIVSIKSATRSEKMYNIVYSLSDVYEPEKSVEYTAVMEYKIIDGKGYWSIYQNAASSQTESAETQGTTAEESVEYSEDELCEKVAKCYKDKYGVEPPLVSVDSVDGNTVTIHAYEITLNHIATWEWFYVDKTTGKASTMHSGDVDLSNY